MHSLQSTDFQRASSILSYFFLLIGKTKCITGSLPFGMKIVPYFSNECWSSSHAILNKLHQFGSRIFHCIISFCNENVECTQFCHLICLWDEMLCVSLFNCVDVSYLRQLSCVQIKQKLEWFIRFFYIFSFSFSLQFILFILDFFLMQCIPNAVVRVIFLPEWLWFHALLFLSINFRWIALNLE